MFCLISKWLCYKQVENLIDLLLSGETFYNDKIDSLLTFGYVTVSVDICNAFPLIDKNNVCFFVCDCGLCTNGDDEFHFPLVEYKKV